ncbi:MAG: hypothetical protein LC102_02880 [Ignavibacteriales bacterium]|nr:MAG: hypothetical protein F9K26_06390 [Ignavibacteriaceae bacterium]MBW7873013.1 hypothetical protein [Ignavibacteria bacterium]MCZ2142358.1 hypothetical protein [Ignavibacteriales bacterium]OQY75880.1 MAG: hypothetical protein B6D45_05015 [Ignavibacteriales bacterium UTCHB3]MBV6445241.1 hypothetical protein [Ignavibacteriaceae bacterium]
MKLKNLTKKTGIHRFAPLAALVFALFLLSSGEVQAQLGKSGGDGGASVLGLIDRAGGLHNASNIGLFFENRGKLYPRRISQGPSGEYPINSGQHYIYRINPYVGIPGNVIQGRYVQNEEWEAVYGYHNNEGAKIAFSDNPGSWHPSRGWPVKDAEGDPIFKSDQDSYCVYNDSNNTIGILGIEVHQTGYTYGVKFAQDMIFYKYQVINKSNKDYDSLYFSIFTDIDVGNVSGGAPEYADDKVDFDKQSNFVWFYDKGTTTEWPSGKTGMMGVAFLETPKVNGVEVGLTDFHYALYNDDEVSDIDSVLYGRMASSLSLYNSPLHRDKYFHIGNNTDLHFDDVSTIPPSGLDIMCSMSSGPYHLLSGDTLTFYTAIIAGENLAQLQKNRAQAQVIHQFDYEIAKPPVTPKLSGIASDTKNTVYWDDAAEKSFDSFTGQYDFEGYRLYKSIDRGIHWNLIGEYDIPNDIGNDKGIQYSYIDTNVTNGFEYWYTVTAYDRGDSLLEPLESPLGKNLDQVNVVSLTPVSSALGRTPVTVGNITQIGEGNSNYQFNIMPDDNIDLVSGEYQVGFDYVHRTDRGVLDTKLSAVISDSSLTKPERYGVFFTAPNRFDFVNLTTGDDIKTDNNYVWNNPNQLITVPGAGMRVRITTPPNTPVERRPKKGDLLTLNFGVVVTKDNDTVIKPRPFYFDKLQATSDGIVFSMTKPNPVKSFSKIQGMDIIDLNFSMDDENFLKNTMYFIEVTGRGFDSEGDGFINLAVQDTAAGAPVIYFDSVYTLSTFSFNGLSGRIEFNSANPPQAGNRFSLESIKPKAPSILDKYRFTLKAPTVNPEVVKNNISKVRVVPNPYIVSSLYEPEFGELRREPLRQIQFINLPEECTIHIFTVDADLLKTIEHRSQNGTEYWDLKTEGGREIASGMYIYVVKSKDGEHIDRFAVIK